MRGYHFFADSAWNEILSIAVKAKREGSKVRIDKLSTPLRAAASIHRVPLNIFW
jgi:hypothetical protein